MVDKNMASTLLHPHMNASQAYVFVIILIAMPTVESGKTKVQLLTDAKLQTRCLLSHPNSEIYYYVVAHSFIVT